MPVHNAGFYATHISKCLKGSLGKFSRDLFYFKRLEKFQFSNACLLSVEIIAIALPASEPADSRRAPPSNHLVLGVFLDALLLRIVLHR